MIPAARDLTERITFTNTDGTPFATVYARAVLTGTRLEYDTQQRKLTVKTWELTFRHRSGITAVMGISWPGHRDLEILAHPRNEDERGVRWLTVEAEETIPHDFPE